MPLNLGILGYGAFAQNFHLPLIRSCPDLRLTAIYSSKSPENLPTGVTHYRDTQALIEAKDIDVILITAPNAVHHPLAKAALQAGKHVVLEKPMTTTTAEAQDLITTARLAQRVLTVFHNRRLDGDYLTLQALIAEERIGNIHRFVSNWDRFRPIVRERWREQAGAGSGIWYDLGPHLIDQATDLFGLPEKITGRCIALRPDSPTVDYAHVTLHYPDKEVQLGTSPYCAAPNPRFRLEGEQGTYVKYGLDPQEQQLKAGMAVSHPQFGLAPEQDGIFYDADSRAHTIPTLAGNSLAFYRNLAPAIHGEAPLLIKPETAMQTIALIELAQQSSDLGRSLPVLPLSL